MREIKQQRLSRRPLSQQCEALILSMPATRKMQLVGNSSSRPSSIRRLNKAPIRAVLLMASILVKREQPELTLPAFVIISRATGMHRVATLVRVVFITIINGQEAAASGRNIVTN